ncbi:hypothetical protein DL96DRAFT_1588884 [Flagelloscypha sp. PMI_526]|nr:hypothetical protein DL96DRAFT_1588884 [Flagelloscypha sp. PMI_526]
MDGFGQLDAVGQPRKFAYVTLEAVPSKLSRCMSSLSGSTWKGAKLRIGEAKPDFRVRLASEINAPAPPTKRRRLNKFKHRYADDMTLITPENSTSHSGWIVTEAGRITRPLRIRPDHPLPPPPLAITSSSDAHPRKRKKPKPTVTRARRRKIDMSLWGSTHTTGVFLDVASPIFRPKPPSPIPQLVRTLPQPKEKQGPEAQVPPSSELKSQKKSVQKMAAFSGQVLSLQAEASESIALLNSIFGVEDWDGRESVPSDIEEQDLNNDKDTADGEYDFEVIKAEPAKPRPPSEDSSEEEELSSESEEPVDVPAAQAPSTTSNLKSLFAPTSEPAAFSLLDQLDLDLELEDDVPFPIVSESVHIPEPAVSASTALARIGRIELDPKAPLFFPGAFQRGKDWKSMGFYRTQTWDEIRQEWDHAKGELTQTWKKRWREASKLRRRRGGGAQDAV